MQLLLNVVLDTRIKMICKKSRLIPNNSISILSKEEEIPIETEIVNSFTSIILSSRSIEQ